MRSGALIALVAAVALLLAAAAGVYAYDTGHEDEIAEGVTVGGVDVGGMSAGEARETLRAELLEPLNQPVVVRARGKRYRLSPREARIAVAVDASVGEAIERSRTGNLLTRTFRDLSGGRVDAAVEPRVTYSSEAVGRLVSRVRKAVDRPARNADVRFAASGLQKVDGQTGLRVDRAELRDRIEAAILEPGAEDRRVRARIVKVAPEVGRDELAERYGTVLAVDRGAFKIRLYKRLKLAKTYPIALGAAGQETPSGLYAIQNKAVNPTWNVPDSDWAGDLAGKSIPPGPDNPIKARWMGIYDGVGIHGTADRGSIGSFASKGCIRMLVEDVTDLYDRVPVGAKIYIS
jgi:lipoprotein-anchoring transpeptidase ErfK/SrfK